MMFWNVKSVVTIVFGIVMFVCVVLLYECGGLLGAALPRYMGGLDGVGWVASALPPLWIADQVRNDVTVLVVLALLYALPCVYCREASMTGRWMLVLSCFTLCSQCQALGQALVLSHKGDLCKTYHHSCVGGNLWKIQLGRLRI